MLWRCWLGGRKGIRPVKTEWWGVSVVVCLERGADLHMAQLMPLPLTVSRAQFKHSVNGDGPKTAKIIKKVILLSIMLTIRRCDGRQCHLFNDLLWLLPPNQQRHSTEGNNNAAIQLCLLQWWVSDNDVQVESVDDVWSAAYGLVHMLAHTLGISHDHSGMCCCFHVSCLCLASVGQGSIPHLLLC